MQSVYLLTLRQLSGRWRLVIMTVLASMPVIIAVLMLRSDNAPTVREFETAILSAMLAGSIAPLVVLAIALSLLTALALGLARLGRPGQPRDSERPEWQTPVVPKATHPA